MLKLWGRLQTQVILPATLQECVYCPARLGRTLDRCGGGICDVSDVHFNHSIRYHRGSERQIL